MVNHPKRSPRTVAAQVMKAFLAAAEERIAALQAYAEMAGNWPHRSFPTHARLRDANAAYEAAREDLRREIERAEG